MLEWLAALGGATWTTVWVPVAVWTVAALAVHAMLRRVRSLHPQTQYSARLALLASLPVGVGLTWLLPPLTPFAWLPQAWWSAAPAVPSGDPLLLLPSTGVFPVAPADIAEPISLPLLLIGAMTVLALAAALLWGGGLVRDLFAVRRLRKRLAGQPAPPLAPVAADLCASLALSRPVQVRTSSEVPVPLTCGTWRPLIVLPHELSPSEQRLALLHELLHVRRHDYLLHLISRALVAACAIHPLMHRLYTAACSYREVANDDAVLRQPGVDRRPYATLLLRFADAPTNRWTAALSFAQPIASLKDRIHAMSQPPASNRPRPIFTLLLAMLLVSMVGTFMACSDVAVDTPATTEEAPLPSLEDATIFEVTETMPQPVGGMEAIAEHVAYTDEAKNAGIEGRVIVQFVVDTEGNVRNPEVMRGLGAGLDEAAVAALEATEWKAGEQNGEPVHVQMAFPVTFRLSDAETRSSEATASVPFAGDEVFVVVEDMPAPVGGAASIQERITYPDMAKRAGVEGRVVVQFVVDTDGTPRDLQVVRGIGGGADEEALRVIQETTFTPGMQRGRAVPVRMSWPITFRLPGNDGATSDRSNGAEVHRNQVDTPVADVPAEAIASIDVKRDEGPNGTVTITLKEGMALEFTDGQLLQASFTDNDQPTIIIRRS